MNFKRNLFAGLFFWMLFYGCIPQLMAQDCATKLNSWNNKLNFPIEDIDDYNSCIDKLEEALVEISKAEAKISELDKKHKAKKKELKKPKDKEDEDESISKIEDELQKIEEEMEELKEKVKPKNNILNSLKQSYSELIRYYDTEDEKDSVDYYKKRRTDLKKF